MLLQQRWYWKWSLAAALVLQSLTHRLPHPGDNDLGFGALVASYVLLLAFCSRNLIKTGMAVVMIGIAMNTVTIIANHGMPVAVPEVWGPSTEFAPTTTHHAQSSDTSLYCLSDVIYLRPTDQMISFGDLVLAVGLIDVAFHGSRKRRSRRPVATKPPEPAVADKLDIATLETFDDEELNALLQSSTGLHDSHPAQRHELQSVDN